MNKYKSRDLKGITRCTFRRERQLSLESGKKEGNAYAKSSLIKETIKNGLLYGYNDADIKKKLDEGFLNLGYDLEQTAKEHSTDAYKQVIRYLHSEKRSPALVPAKILKPFGLMEVEVRPDLIFYGEKAYEYITYDDKGKKIKSENRIEPYIEVVKLCCKLPDVTMKGQKKDGSAEHSLELYTLLMYGRELAPDDDDETVHIGASYYFLRKKDDNKKFDLDFFNTKGAGNIVSLWENRNSDGTGYERLDDIFRPQFEEFENGESVCDETLCEKCEFYERCHYNLPPEYISTEKKVTSLSDVQLSKEQEKAVFFRKGIARINAGAGAGKTLVSALRVAYMLDEGIKPEDICMLTFTNTGAKEMTERVKLYCDDLECEADVSKLTSTTFNAFGDKIVKENYKKFGFTNEPRLIDDIERYGIISKILGDYTVSGLDYKNFDMDLPYVKGALYVASEAFDIIKRECIGRGEEEKLKSLMHSTGCIKTEEAYSQLINLYSVYNEMLMNNNLIEYADQELLIMDLLAKNPYYFEDYGYKHIMVDEFQDSNDLQLEILKKLIDTPFFESFMVVGDDSQSIFGFRGSNPKIIIDFWDKLGEEGTDFYLLENHRSTPEIINFANKINSLNIHRVVKDLVSTRSSGNPVFVDGFWDKASLNKFVVDAINSKISEGKKYEDICYIASTRVELMAMGTILTENNIPWIMLNPEPILENSSVKAAIALAELCNDDSATKQAFVYLNAVRNNKLLEDNSDADISLLINNLQKTLTNIKSNNDMDAYKLLIEDLNTDDEVFESFKKSLFLRTSLEDMIKYSLDYLRFGKKQAFKRCKDYPGVVLTTAHSSKGMEWPVVINNITKYHSKQLSYDEIEEKRRLLFVSVTRARDELFVIGQKVAFGPKNNRIFNQFLHECFDCVGKEFSTIEPIKEKTKKR